MYENLADLKKIIKNHQKLHENLKKIATKGEN